MNYKTCFHCGSDYGLHKSESLHCPVGGVEETREGKKQQWEETTFLDAPTRKLELAAPEMLQVLVEINTYWEAGNFSRNGEMWSKIKTAIKKATP